MDFVNIIAALALVQFMLFGFQTGSARGRYNVAAPAVSGHEIFERYFRVQQNTLEQLIMFVPSLYIFSFYVSARWAAILGVVYLIGRQIYSASYVKNPAKRSLGFMITALPVLALLVGGLVMAVAHALRA